MILFLVTTVELTSEGRFEEALATHFCLIVGALDEQYAKGGEVLYAMSG